MMMMMHSLLIDGSAMADLAILMPGLKTVHATQTTDQPGTCCQQCLDATDHKAG
jgi:hypothetical protein